MGDYFIDKKRSEILLGQLGEALEEAGADKMDILVCGGMALMMQELIPTRATTDIDGIGFVKKYEESVVLEFPETRKAFTDARARVAAANNLGKRWINFQSRTLIDNGLPGGIIERAFIKEYGKRLRVRFCSRLDIVALKMYAAADPKRDVDLSDLQSLEVTLEEAEFGARYCLEKNLDKETVAELLEAIGCEKLARDLIG